MYSSPLIHFCYLELNYETCHFLATDCIQAVQRD